MLSSWSSWFSYKSPLLQESVLDITELVGWAKQQFGELEDGSLSDLVHVKGYPGVCVCVLKIDDMFIDWSPWSVVEPIVLSKPWSEYGLSSNQVKTNDIRNVVLLVVDPSSIHHYIFWSDQCYHRVHMMVEVRWYRNSNELLLSPSAAFCPPPMVHVEHQPSVENFVSNAFVFRSWSLCLDGRSDFLEFTCIRCKLPPWIWGRFDVFPLESSQISHAYVRSILWFGRLITSTPYVFLAHEATDWFVQGEEVSS